MKAGGSGLEFGEVGIPAEFNIWTREAGEGKIAISIEGPSKAEINFKDRKDGSCNVAYTVKEPGQYHVSLKVSELNGQVIVCQVKFSSSMFLHLIYVLFFVCSLMIATFRIHRMLSNSHRQRMTLIKSKLHNFHRVLFNQIYRHSFWFVKMVPKET